MAFSALSRVLLACAFLGLASVSAFQSSGLNFAFPNTSVPVPFSISVDPVFVEQSLAKVRNFRPSRDIFNEWTNEGPPRANITGLATYWAEQYDWFEVQNQINLNFSHYATTVPGSVSYPHPTQIHFVHERSTNENSLPLLLLHGWPSTHLLWAKVIAPLVSPTNKHDASFHVVAPDLPGYGFSPAPTNPDLGPSEMASVFVSLMQQLGYDKFGVVSTDLGWPAGCAIAHDDADKVVGHFSDFFIVVPNATDLARYAANETTPDESSYIAGLNVFTTNHTAYSEVHIQKPLAISLAMSDSPVGFAGWAWDLIRTVSDGYEYSYSDLITTTMMLWIQGTYGNIRSYLKFDSAGIPSCPASTIPTGVSLYSYANGPFPGFGELAVPPPSWIERTANLVFYSHHPSGGHFPAISQPEQWVQDLRSFFAKIQP